jgi:hypothetical protein
VKYRLTDDQLNLACLAPDDDADPYPASIVLHLATELRERRAQDLTTEEIQALRWAHSWLELDGHAPRSLTNQQVYARALAVLGKLTGGGAP